jgi:hypothetical protein
MIGDGGSGKTTAAAAVFHHFHDYAVAQHFCKFDRKAHCGPRKVLLSFVNQFAFNLPLFKNQLARLNLKYLIEQSHVHKLAKKILIEPLHAMEKPLNNKMIVVDGIDQCKMQNQNDLLGFIAYLSVEIPPWISFVITSKPSPELTAKIQITSLIDFSARNDKFLVDTDLLIEEIVTSFRTDEIEEAKRILRLKSQGNFSYLEFTKQALSNLGMEEEDGLIALEVLNDLPDSLSEIYEEIFEDKFGKGRNRMWKKVFPVLEVITCAAAGPYDLVSEDQAQEYFSYSNDDMRMLRRLFMDIVSVYEGCYRIDSSALFEWLSSPSRCGEQFFVDTSLNPGVLQKLLLRDSAAATDECINFK